MAYVDFIQHPLHFLQDSDLTTSPEELAARFKDRLLSSSTVARDELLAKVPSFADRPMGSLASGSFVRFRAMVQDNGLNSQYYKSAYTLRNTATNEKRTTSAHFCDSIPLTSNDGHWIMDASCDDMKSGGTFFKKSQYLCVSIPGESSWVKDEFVGFESNHAVTSVTASLEQMSVSHDGKPLFSIPEALKHKIPHYNDNSKVAIVKCYGEEPEEVNLNATFEFFGILEMPEPSGPNDGMDEIDYLDDAVALSSLPVVHCVFREPVDFGGHPLQRSIVARLIDKDFNELKDMAVDYLSGFVLGDRLVAEYLLLQLTSRIHNRSQGLPVGFMPLNIYNLPIGDQNSFSSNVFSAVSALLPRCVHIPISIENLNKQPFAPGKFAQNPFKSGEVVGLRAGALQLTDGTWILADETVMDKGVLNEQGVLNYTHMKVLISTASVPYGFDLGGSAVFTKDFPVDFGLVILSNGRCMFSTDLAIPLLPSSDAPASNWKGSLDGIRALISAVRHENYTIPEDMLEVVHTDYANERKKDVQESRKEQTPEALLNRLEIARGLSLLSGHNQLTAECWQRAGQMESQRFTRVRSHEASGCNDKPSR
ncbi:hypothetical protein HK101_008537 [Irineochytrium annulatum]|nr:hypothetical protein HK101_008537 [Irineochytrium annulatum]